MLSWRDGDHPESGGAETYLEQTAQVLSERGHNVTIFSAHFDGAPARISRGRVQIIRRGGRMLCYLRGLEYLASHAAEFDVVIDAQNGVPFWSPLATRRPVVNLTHHVHQAQWPIVFGPVIGRVGWFLESRVAPRVYRRAHYVTVSDATRRDLATLGIAPDRISLTYSGNDHRQLAKQVSTAKSENPSLIVLCRLVPHKQVEKAIDITAALAVKYPGLHLDVVGSGYWSEELIGYAQRAGVAAKVTFHGFVDEETKHQLLARAWVSIMASQKEGWGLTIVEAGLHRTPSVAFSYAGGVTESIRHGSTGLLARNDDELRQYVDELLADSVRRNELGAAAQVLADSFTWENTALQLEATLLSVTDPRRTA